jgi:hypothetical protein
VFIDRDFARLAKEHLKVDARSLPKLRSRVLRVAGFPARATSFTLDIPAALLTRAAEPKPEAPVKPAPRAVPGTVVVLLAPDGERTWISVAGDEKTAINRLEAAHAGKEGRLAEVPELSALKSERLTSGGFWTLEALLGWLKMAKQKRSSELDGLMNHAPNHGRSIGLVRWRVSESGKGFRVDSSLSVPRGTVQDLGGVAPWLLGSLAD